MSKLTPKQRKFVVAKVQGKSNRQAYKEAYNVAPNTKLSTIDPNASRVAKNEQVQAAIDEALKAHELTPEYAIKELKTIVDQNKEIGAKRLAIKDVLELHGYQAKSHNKVNISIDKGFFGSSR